MSFFPREPRLAASFLCVIVLHAGWSLVCGVVDVPVGAARNSVVDDVVDRFGTRGVRIVVHFSRRVSAERCAERELE